MKTIVHTAIYVIFFLVLFNTSHAQEGWQPVVTVQDCKDIFFSDTLTGWRIESKTIFDASAIFKTTDGGISWNQVFHEWNIALRKIIIKGSNGYCVGLNGAILKSSDGGNTWHFKASGTAQNLVSVFFLDTNNGWACGGNTIVRTTDGGETWTTHSLPANYGSISDIAFFSTQHGYILNSLPYFPDSTTYLSNAYSTTDGGSSWIPLNIPFHRSCYSIALIAPSTVIIGGTHGILTSFDQGSTWVRSLDRTWEADGMMSIIDISFVNEHFGWAVGALNSYMYRSTDGGDHWERQWLNIAFSDEVFSVSGVDSLHGWCASSNIILSTQNGGRFQLYAPLLQSPSINAVDQSTLPTLTWNYVPTATSYQMQISTNPLFTSNVYTGPSLTGTSTSTPELNFNTDYYWRVRCSDGTLTTTWSVLRKFRTAALMPNDLPANGESDVMMQPALRWHGDLTVSKFRVQLSTDPEFGQSVIIDTTITARSIVPPRLQPATRYYWRVFSLVNDTSTLWLGVWSFTTQYAEKFPFSVNDTWFYSGVPYGSLTKRIVSIASDGMRVVQCTGRDKNGESTGHEYWFYRFGNFYISTQPELNSQEIICYISSLTKDSVSLPGSYAYTWKVQPVNMFGAIYTSQLSTCVVNMGRWGILTFKYRMTEQLGITEIYRNDFDFYIKSYSIVGVIKNGVLFGDSTSSILNTPEKISIPGTYQLHQNFPNPFNPSTTFTFSVPAEGFVSLKVYDVMGREAASIVEEKVSAGTHERKWNAFNLPSGLYYYRMMAGTFSETKRLILLK